MSIPFPWKLGGSHLPTSPDPRSPPAMPPRRSTTFRNAQVNPRAVLPPLRVGLEGGARGWGGATSASWCGLADPRTATSPEPPVLIWVPLHRPGDARRRIGSAFSLAHLLTILILLVHIGSTSFTVINCFLCSNPAQNRPSSYNTRARWLRRRDRCR